MAEWDIGPHPVDGSTTSLALKKRIAALNRTEANLERMRQAMEFSPRANQWEIRLSGGDRNFQVEIALAGATRPTPSWSLRYGQNSRPLLS